MAATDQGVEPAYMSTVRFLSLLIQTKDQTERKQIRAVIFLKNNAVVYVLLSLLHFMYLYFNSKLLAIKRINM